jgi:L-aminopeptidase/D-esterase-like protein
VLEPGRTVEAVNAVVLTGGSAFGLAACDGVVRWCEERGIGHPTSAGPVPIVVGLVLYDLGVGDPAVRPGPAEGYAACESARAGDQAVGTGLVGAGTGATIGKWRGQEGVRPGGLGSAVVRHGDLVVAALMAVNAVGELRPAGSPLVEPRLPAGPALVAEEGQATTIGLVVTNARLDKTACLRAAQSGHDGMARALDPVHTGGDGDAVVVAATGEVDAPAEIARALAGWVVERAIIDAIGDASQSD